ncbi:hypothetical protein PIB30_026465 [Stylosanthes scabra]|uniref:Putative plant transposon protein domain-containing protein n=1 Tax=Stylosanthes scabra TaxID=79078 RepID=A0ABU6W8B7_9FABA|nr:hypothetical protein [Stylosanthes scabra]
MRFKDDTPGAETDYNTRLHSNQMLEEVLSDLCILGATWKLGGGQPPQPIQLRRKELQPLARGWLELIIHNIHPSSNRSEVTVANAILIHSIIKGEDVRVEELISTRLVNIAQSLQHKGKLGFSSLIYKLCKDAGVSFREYRRTPYVEVASNITAKMKSIIAQQQEVIATQNREFQAMKRKQDQLEKELSEIKKAQINPSMNGSNEELQRLRKIIEDQRVVLVQQNRAPAGSSQVIPAMAASSEGKLDKIASSVAEFKEELTTFKERHEQLANLSYKQYTTIRKEQESVAKEVKEIKEKQINPVDNETLKDVARMTFEQREELKQIRKQMREWTMYSSARECYDIWAHQKSDPNLVQMPLHDLTKMVYDNLENKRPMFSGALKSDSNAGQVSRPEPIPPEDLHLYNNQQVSFFEE